MESWLQTPGKIHSQVVYDSGRTTWWWGEETKQVEERKERGGAGALGASAGAAVGAEQTNENVASPQIRLYIELFGFLVA